MTAPTSTATLGHPRHGRLEVRQGLGLLSGVPDGPGVAAHEQRYGDLPLLDADALVDLTARVAMHGRGGAAFPFGRKVATAAARRGRPVVVVNLGEGEPASHKDAALVQVAPHLVLDGAVLTARALGTGEVHVVLPGEARRVSAAVRSALGERGRRRRDRKVRWTVHEAAEGFVAGQSSAVLELMAGRPNLPVTTWRPTAEAGHRGRPTVLSNAETFAQVGRLAHVGAGGYCRLGTADEPGTTLLTVDGDGSSSRAPQVVEVPFGSGWCTVLPPARLASPVLLGGYHGTWSAPGALLGLPVSRLALTAAGLSLGAGVVLPLDSGCPVDRTSSIVSYLASQTAGRCGPCFNGLPAIASALSAVACGRGRRSELRRLTRLVDGRGACAHPDGTVRLVRSLLTSFEDEVASHARGRCRLDSPARLEVSA